MPAAPRRMDDGIAGIRTDPRALGAAPTAALEVLDVDVDVDADLEPEVLLLFAAVARDTGGFAAAVGDGIADEFVVGFATVVAVVKTGAAADVVAAVVAFAVVV